MAAADVGAEIPWRIAFSLERADVAAIEADAARRAKFDAGRRIIVAIYFAAAAIEIAVGIVGLSKTPHAALTWLGLLVGVYFAFLGWFTLRIPSASWMSLPSRVGIAQLLDVDDAGVTYAREHAPPIRLRWDAIASIAQTKTAVTISARVLAQPIVIPARARADGGDALYVFIASRIVSRRMLIPRTEAFEALPRSVTGSVMRPPLSLIGSARTSSIDRPQRNRHLPPCPR